MSTIPKTAMPHARAESDRTTRRARLNAMLSDGRRWATRGYDSATRAARDHPRIAMSALGAALVASLAAAFGPKLWRRRAAMGF